MLVQVHDPILSGVTTDLATKRATVVGIAEDTDTGQLLQAAGEAR